MSDDSLDESPDESLHESKHAGQAAPPSPHRRDADATRRALHGRAEELGATAEELEMALDALALQAQAVLHKLRGGSLH